MVKKYARSAHPPGRLSPQAGIAIGPILFVIGLLAVLATVMSQTGSISSTTIAADRIAPDIRSQANLIRAKISECQMMRGSYPTSTGTGTLVSALVCPGDPSGQDNLWTGARPANLPPVPSGFGAWQYVNGGSTGGRCIKIQPTTQPVTDRGIIEGLTLAVTKFSDMESDYLPASQTQRLIIWVTPPSGTPDTNCAVGT